MKTAEQREAEFRKELQALLDKHGAELEVTDDGKDYGMHSGVCRITMMSIYDYDSDSLVADFCEFEI